MAPAQSIQPQSNTLQHSRKRYHAALEDALLHDPTLHGLIANFKLDRRPLAAYVRNLRVQFGTVHKKVTEKQLIRLLFRQLAPLVKDHRSAALTAAYECFKVSRYTARNAKRNFLVEMDMTKVYRDNPDRLIYGSPAVEKIFLRRLKTSFPKLGTWVCESKDILGLWRHHIMHGQMSDNRTPRREPVLINQDDLRKIIPADMSCIVRDPVTDEVVLVVLRHCIGDLDVLEWLDGIIGEATSTRRNIRRDDKGDLVMIGLSAGSRSKPCFHWVRNLLRKHTDKQIGDFDRKQCTAFAFLWNFLRHRLPLEVLKNFDSWMETTMLPGMSADWENFSRKGSYLIELPDRTFTFDNIKLAPPAGVVAQNYARAMHYEPQPHQWAAAFTSTRNASPDDGGHFYLGAYGIKVEAAGNSLVVWQPRHVHGTSLQRRLPADKNPRFLQRGMAIVTSPRLATIWKSYVSKLGLDMKEVEKAARAAEKALYTSEFQDEVFV